jgi:hypothetical protein
VYTFGELHSLLLNNHISALADLNVNVDDETTQADNGTDTTVLLSHYHETIFELDSYVQSHELSNSTVPLVLPRRRYAGICNIETVRDGKFLI